MSSLIVKLGRILRALWLQTGIAIICLLLLDAALSLVLRAAAPANRDSRILADGYHNASWVPEYFADLAGAWVRWLPYAYWIGKPYRSRYLNIGADGLRATIAESRPSEHSGAAFRIFMFGGSTMWGEGSRDAYTIPSWLQRMLDAGNYRAQVINYGQDGYVSSQEMILLFEQLQRGNIPGLVVFYDGFNDSTAAMLDGAAGQTFGEANRRDEFNAFNQWASDDSVLYRRAAAALARNSGLGRLARKILIRLAPNRFRERKGELVAWKAAPGSAQSPRLQEEVVTTYLANKHLIEAAGRSFGFKCLFFWQPTVWTKTRLTAYEADQKWLPGEKEFMDGVYSRLAAIAQREAIHDLSGVFGDSEQPYYIDDAHLTEAGNRVVAQAMLPYVLGILQEGSRGSGPPRAAHATANVTAFAPGASRPQAGIELPR